MATVFSKQNELFCNFLATLSIIFIIVLGFYFEIIYSELPCPLCLLQRAGFFGIGLGFLLNLVIGIKSRHYAVSLLSALFTAAVAMRQILLHIVPGTGSYGSAILGMHMYTWSFIFAATVIITISIFLLIQNQSEEKNNIKLNSKFVKHSLCWVLVILALLNAYTTYSICGFAECPDNPTRKHFFLR